MCFVQIQERGKKQFSLFFFFPSEDCTSERSPDYFSIFVFVYYYYSYFLVFVFAFIEEIWCEWQCGPSLRFYLLTLRFCWFDVAMKRNRWEKTEIVIFFIGYFSSTSQNWLHSSPSLFFFFFSFVDSPKNARIVDDPFSCFWANVWFWLLRLCLLLMWAIFVFFIEKDLVVFFVAATSTVSSRNKVWCHLI